MTNKDGYKDTLRRLQIELVKLQRRLIAENARVLVIVEGRDGAGKDGTIKRVIAHMSPRETRIFAPPKPSDHELAEWYFQRFVQHLPSNGEFVIFNRSWYNRAGVERVMGFCSEQEVENFFATVNEFEALLVRSGIDIRKYYLDITRGEQKERLAARKNDPLKSWKISPVDAVATKKWDAYSKARNEMLRRTHHAAAPWRIVDANHKKAARLAVIADILRSFSYAKKNKKLAHTHRELVKPFSPRLLKDGFIAP